MYETRSVVRRRIYIFLINIIIVFAMVLKFLNKNIMPVAMEYGRYQCTSIVTKFVNEVIESDITDEIKKEIVIYNNEGIVSFDINTAVLNSISSNAIKKLQSYFYKLERGLLEESFLSRIGVEVEKGLLKKGIIYEIPFSRAFNNPLISNLGINIPVKYSIIGEIQGQVISTIKEYGINNALIEINLEINSKSMITIPSLSSEEKMKVSIPLVMKLIQGEIPDSFFGSHILGGVN